MTVVALEDGVFVHSPIHLKPSIRKHLDGSGEVKWVVAPNKRHHLYLDDFRHAYPGAEFFGPEGLARKRPDFPFTRLLTEAQDFPWNPHISHRLVAGAPMYDEVVFFHHATRTLILTDIAYNMGDTPSWRTRVWLKLMGSYRRFGWSPLEKLALIKDRAAFRRSMEGILEWDFDRIVLAHGRVVDAGGKQMMRKAYL